MAVSRRGEVDKASVRLLNDTLVPENEREVLIVTFMSPVVSQTPQMANGLNRGKPVQAALAHRVKDGWAVRRLSVAMNKADLELAMDLYVRPFDKQRASNYEVRVIALPNTIPPVPLLVVGQERALVGMYGTGLGRSMQGALVLYGAEATSLARKHFHSVWDRQDSCRIRSLETGKVDQAAYNRVCQELEMSAAGQNTR